MRIAIGIAFVIALIVAPIIYYMGTRVPTPQYELVYTCKPPFLRRAKEFVLRDPTTGTHYYQDAQRRLSPIASDVDPAQACKRT